MLWAVLNHSVITDSSQPHGLARQSPLSVGFSRQENWSGLPCPPPGDLPDPGLPLCKWIPFHPSHQGSPQGLNLDMYISTKPLV